MAEFELRWSIKINKKRWVSRSLGEKKEKDYFLYRISVPRLLALSLISLVPCWDLKNKIIVFKQEQECGDGYLIRLRWASRRERNGRDNKVFTMYYISVPDDILEENNLLDQEPYLDPEKKVIVFRPKQVNVQNVDEAVKGMPGTIDVLEKEFKWFSSLHSKRLFGEGE